MKPLKSILVDGATFSYDGDERFAAKVVLAAIMDFLRECSALHKSLLCKIGLKYEDPFHNELGEDITLSVRGENIVLEFKEDTYSDSYPYYTERSIAIPLFTFLDWKDGGEAWRTYTRNVLSAQISKKISLLEKSLTEQRDALVKIA